MTSSKEQPDVDTSRISFLTASTPQGWMLMAATKRGICALTLGDDADALEAELRAAHPGAEVAPGADTLREWVDAVVAYLSGTAPLPDLPLDVHATEFRRRVWSALQEIPAGETRTYSEVAAAIGAPGSARAVASACAGNQIALIIPCHRVVRSDGSLSGFRWGVERKAQLLALEL